MFIARLPFPPIYYAERPGSPEESFANGVCRVKRIFDVRWPDRWMFMACLLGWAKRSFNNGTPYISRSIPDGYDASALPVLGSGDTWLWATQIERVEGIAPLSSKAFPSNVFEYDTARITVVYESLLYDIRSDNDGKVQSGGMVDESTLKRYVTKLSQPTAEFLTLPYGAYRFVSDQSPVVGSVGRLLCSQELTYIWHQVPATPKGIANDVVGCVNLTTFDGCGPGTLLLVSAERKPWRQVDGTLVFDYTYKMKFFEPGSGLGHNHFLHHKQSGTDGATSYSYELITSNGQLPTLIPNGGQTVFESKEFADLFRPVLN